MRAVKKVIVLLSAVVLGCACLFTVGCANEELLQKIDSLAEKVETLEGENISLTEKLGELQTENEELAEKLAKAEEEQREHILETSYQNMFVFDIWRPTSGIRNNRITFNYPDSEISFECTVESGLLCGYRESANIETLVKTKTCKSGDQISWHTTNNGWLAHDFIDVLIKKGNTTLGYAVIYITRLKDEYHRFMFNAEVLTAYCPYKNGYIGDLSSDELVRLRIAEAKETVAERNKDLDAFMEEWQSKN